MFGPCREVTASSELRGPLGQDYVCAVTQAPYKSLKKGLELEFGSQRSGVLPRAQSVAVRLSVTRNIAGIEGCQTTGDKLLLPAEIVLYLYSPMSALVK